jgi:hypothetical protein
MSNSLGQIKGDTLLLKIQDKAHVARGMAILQGTESAVGIKTIQLFVSLILDFSN